MRISEALSLTTEDVILKSNLLIIYDGKGNVSRSIPYDDSLGFWLKKYNNETYTDNKNTFLSPLEVVNIIDAQLKIILSVKYYQQRVYLGDLTTAGLDYMI